MQSSDDEPTNQKRNADQNSNIDLPFGHPDGSKGSFETLIRQFVHLDQRRFPSGISFLEDSRFIRVVVGKKGSGKSLYLRRLQASTRSERAIFATEVTEEIPGTSSVIKFCQLFEKSRLDEAWQKAWRIAIIRSCVSYLTAKKYFLTDYNTGNLTERLSGYQTFVPKYNVERSIYAELTEVICKYKTATHFMEFAQASAWDDIQRVLSDALKDCPPIFFYLDGMDDEFGHAPMEWLRCQRGLYHAVMRLVRKQNSLSSRLHVVIAIRDVVHSSLLTTNENRERHRNTPEVSLLDWDYLAIKHFFTEKVKQLKGDFAEYSSISDFCGVKEVQSQTRRGSEGIERYLIRHTRLLPRDIVQLGNDIALSRMRWRAENLSDERWGEALKKIVSWNARLFADEQISICANQLASHDAPLHSARHGYSEYYTSSSEYTDERRKTIVDFIKVIGKESFFESDLLSANELSESEVPVGVNLGTILWQNGLIGIKRNADDPDFEFCNLSYGAGFSLPEGCLMYAFHPIVLDAIPGIVVNLTVAPGGVNVINY